MTPQPPPRPIDAVILWVDGNDPAHRARRSQYQTTGQELKRDDVGGEDRFANCDEVVYCVGSILRHARFVRNIFIVTDRQTPPVFDMIKRNFPGDEAKVEVVDHSELLRGYEQYLPIFNCNSLEAMLWRIPGLSERYVYFNDDFLLAGDVSESDWFDAEGSPVLRGRWFSARTASAMYAVKSLLKGRKMLGFKHFMIRSAALAKTSKFPLVAHAPYPMRRSVMEDIFRAHPEWLDLNLRHRFRHEEQFNPQILSYLIGGCTLRPERGAVLFIQPHGDPAPYVKRKLAEAERMGDKLKFVCVNAMHRIPEPARSELHRWLCERAGITL